MLTTPQLHSYLDRLSCQGDLRPGLPLLTRLHQAHLQQIPFENLDIRLGIPINLAPDALFQKILNDRRGGFCYELNYAFSLLLTQLGFQVRLIAAEVYNGHGYGPAFDHLLLAVGLEDGCWIADVGFGVCFRTPLRIGGEGIVELKTTYSLQQDPDRRWVLYQAREGQPLQPQYRFALQGYELTAFLPMCRYQQTSPDSHFTQKSICSVATPQGRISLSNDKCIVTTDGRRQVSGLHNAAEYRTALQTHFKMTLPPDARIDRLLSQARQLPPLN